MNAQRTIRCRVTVLVAVMLVILTGCTAKQVFGSGPTRATPTSSAQSRPAPLPPRSVPGVFSCAADVLRAKVCLIYESTVRIDQADFYRIGPTKIPFAADIAISRMKARFKNPIQAVLLEQIKGWPKTLEEDLPRLSINSVTFDPTGDVATLVTTQSWRITTADGKVLFKESDATHTVTLLHTAGIVDWVVTNIK